MKTLFDPAAVLRKAIRKCKKWKFTGSLENISDENLPMELYSFFRWVIQGPNNSFSAEEKSDEVHKRAMSLAQSTVSMCLTERQIKYEKSKTVRLAAEMPQQLAVSVAVHQVVRSKKLICMLHGFGISVDYNRILRVEAQIEASVLKRMAQNDGLYLRPDMVMGRHVFFAIDNVDFSEDIPDGKRTFHGTAMAVYQRIDPDDKLPDLNVDTPYQSRSVRELPDSITSLLECPTPPPRPAGTVYPNFGLFVENEIPIRVRRQDFSWLIGRSLSRSPTDDRDTPVTEAQISTTSTQGSGSGNRPAKSTEVPVWSGFNSLVSDTMPVTRIGTPP